MKVAVNAAWMTPGKAGGMEWYARNLVRELGRMVTDHEFVLVTSERNDHVFATPTAWERIVHDGTDVDPVSYRRRPEGPSLGRKLERRGVDVLLCPFMYSLPEDTDIPTVNTIPDLQHEHLPKLFNPFELGSRLMGYRRSIDRAARVLSISEAVRQDLLATFPGLDPGHVVATPLGLNEDCREVDSAQAHELALATAVAHRLERPFVYYPANAWPHKNHAALLDALAVAVANGADFDLVLSGSSENFAREHGARVQRLGLNDRVRHLGYVSRPEVFGLYHRARALVLPSRFEGFGLPVLEAMQFDTRVACSDIPALREVGGELVDYFDPEDPDAIAATLVAVAEAPDDIDHAGYIARLATYTYASTAQTTLTALESVYGQGGPTAPTAVSVPLSDPGVPITVGPRLPIALRSPRRVVLRCHRETPPSLLPRRDTGSVAVAVDGVVVMHRRVPAGGSHRLEVEFTMPLDQPEIRTLRVDGFTADGGPAEDLVIDELFVGDAHYGLVRVA